MSDQTTTNGREIKFRAWDKGTRKIIRPEFLGMNGHFIEPSGKGIFSLQHTTITTDGSFKNAETGEAQNIDRIEGYMLKPWQMANDNLVLMQYTGLKDRNGVEIYEGDIVESNESDVDGRAYQVVFEDGCFYASHENQSYFLHELEWKVVANVHENPRYLQGIIE